MEPSAPPPDVEAPAGNEAAAAPAVNGVAISVMPGEGARPLGQPLIAGAPVPPNFQGGAPDFGTQPLAAHYQGLPPVQATMWGPPAEEWRHELAAEAQRPEAKALYGRWSTGHFDCLDDVGACVCSCCPCTAFCFLAFRLFSIVERTGPLELPAMGRVSEPGNARTVACIVVGIEFLGATLWYFTHPFLAFVLHVCAFIGFWLFYKGVQARFRIAENDVQACVCVFFCNVLTFLRLGRHADTYGVLCGTNTPVIPFVNHSLNYVQPSRTSGPAAADAS